MISVFHHLISNINFATFDPPYNIKSNYGWLHVYALTMTLGIFVAILACYVKARIHQLPGEVLILGVVFIIPTALLFASFFGKADFTNWDWSAFFSLFAFWKAGMSIHGGVLGGVISGIIFLIYPSRKYQISLWVWLDCIIPNILLGQVIGRWGNFFNHELLGVQTTLEHLRWLPNWISHNCWQWADASQSHPELINPLGPANDINNWVIREPIFLYESFLNFLAWTFITFGIPNLGKWFGKKPWKRPKYNKNHPIKFHKRIPKFENYNTSWKYSFIKQFDKKYQTKNSKYKNYLSHKEIWNIVYYQNKVPLDQLDTIKLDKYYSRNLTKLHNPDKWWIVRCGVQAGAYFFFWNIIRFFLETQREDEILFIHNIRWLDYTIILSVAFIGIILMIIAEWFSPYHNRKRNWLYEKEY